MFKKLFFGFISTLIVFSLVPITSLAMTFDASESISIDELTEDDLYLTGKSVTINEEVKGDLMVVASSLNINAKVHGDVLATAGTINVNAEILDDARLGAANIAINANIGGDLIATAGNVNITEAVDVGGDALVAAGLLTFNGSIGKDLQAFLANLSFNGEIAGNAEIFVDRQFLFGEKAKIKGDLSYYAIQKTDFNEGIVDGKIEFNSVEGSAGIWEEMQSQFQAQRLIFKGFSFLAILIIAFVLVVISPRHVINTAAELKGSFWKSFLVGLVASLVLFSVGVILMLTVVGIPLAFIIFALTLISIYIGKIFFALWFSKLFFTKGAKDPRRSATFGLITLGLLFFYLVSVIPFYVGFISTIIFTLSGFGAFLRSRRTYFKFLQKKKMA